MLDNIIKFSIKNKFIISLLTLVLIIGGVWSATQLPIDAVPDITNNQVQIYTSCPSLAGQEVEQLVTFPIEQQLANIPNVVEIRSISRFGLSVITVVFEDDIDIYFARQLVLEKLNEATENIPKGIGKPELAPVSTGLGEVYQYILHPKKGSEGKYDSKALREMQDWIVARQLNGTKGIAEVNSFGGELKQYEVSVNPYKLKSFGIGITEIFDVLEKNNQNTGGAYIDKKPEAHFIRGIGLITSLQDVENIAIKNVHGSIPVLIKDVAKVEYGHAIRYGAMTYNGEVDAVGGIVMMLKGENSNDVVKRVKEKIEVIQKSLPSDVIIEPFLDRTQLVNRAIGTVEKNLLEGALIVIFVLVLFLGNLRAGLIVASAIPLSLLFALSLMHFFGVSANLMSLGAIDFGLIVDGAVIIVEATLHHLGLRKSINKLTQQEMDDEVFKSASKIRGSAAFGEIIILIVYIPILTLVGVEGKMFTPMAKTVGFAILGALILSLTYIPMMCALFLSKETKQKQTFSDKMINYLQSIYKPLLEKSYKIKYWIISLTVALFVVCLFVFKNMGGEFIPQLQEGDFAFHCILPQGSSLSQSLETSMQASRIIKKFDEVKMVVGKTGTAEVPTDPMPPEATDMMIILKPKNEWKEKKSYSQLSNEIFEALEVIPGVFFEANQPIQMRFNELMTGIRQDVAVKIFGENMDSLALYADKVSEEIAGIKGVSAPQIERVNGLPQINIEYDRAKFANYGLNVEEVNNIVNTAFAGKIAGQVYENERRFDLVVRLDSASRTSIEDVSNLMVPTQSGLQVPLSQIANVNYKLGAAQISRESGKRRIVIGFNVKGRDVTSVVHDIQQKLNEKIKLPTGYYFTYGGQFENLQKASKRLMIAVPISLLLIFMLLFFTFNSVGQASLIFTAIPMSAIGGVFALILRGMPFSISAGVGFIALFGVAVLNGIVLIGTFNQLEKEGVVDIWDRVLKGTQERLRPVIMTATVASLGFLPMAISTSAGAEVQKPLATVVIGGLITATLLTLFVLPLLYSIYSSKFKAKSKVSVISCLLLGLVFTGTPDEVASQSKYRLDLNTALKLALENNESIHAGNLEIQSRQAMLKTINELPKLDVNTQWGQYNSINFDHSIQVTQSIPFPTLFKAKRQQFQKEIKVKESEQEITILELKHKVRYYYNELQYLECNHQQLSYLDSLFEEYLRVAKLRFKAGDIKKVEISTAETKQGEVNLLLKQNISSIQVAKNNLAMLMKIKEPFEIEEEFEPLDLDTLNIAMNLSTNPYLQNLSQQAQQLESAGKVERALGMPEFTVAYTNQSLIGTQLVSGQDRYFNGTKRFSYFNVGIAIPLTYGATKAKMNSLKFSQEAILKNAQQQEDVFNAQLKNEVLQYQNDLAQYSYYKKQAIPNSMELISAAQLGYRTGDISYVEYLFALQTVSEVRLNYLKSIQRLNQTAIRIIAIINQ